jgi:hypothetical protein
MNILTKNAVQNHSTNEEEIWRDIPEYEGLYQASSLGRIKRLKSIAQGKKGRGRRIVEERIVEPRLFDSEGRGSVALYKDGKCRHIRVHILVCLAFIGERPKGQYILRLNGNFKDNRACNLRYAGFWEILSD